MAISPCNPHIQAYYVYLKQHPEGVRWKHLKRHFHLDVAQQTRVLNYLLTCGLVSKFSAERGKGEHGSNLVLYVAVEAKSCLM